MSSREPLWFCHECHAEMRPIMVPDPVCASCRGSFVEKMEDPADDPREFAHPGQGDLDAEGMPPGMDTFLLSLQTLVDRGIAEGRRQSPRSGSDIGTPGNRVTFQIRTGSSQRPNAGVRPGSGGAEQPLTMDEFLRRESDHTGSGGTTNRRPSMAQGVRSGSGGAEQPLTMDEFLRREPQHTGGGTTITGPFMAQYLMALLGQRDPSNDFFGRGMGDPAMEGRMGDYVFNQEALDQIITQLMDNSNAYRPVPATEEIISGLPREVLEHDSPMLEKDCAVCKDQFKLDTDDPDEQVVVTLPCKHAFHEPCILPWLKSSGTCPVCRHALVPQPEHHPSANPGPDPSSHSNRPPSPSSGSRNQPPRRDGGQGNTGILQSLFGGLVGGGRAHASTPSTRHTRSNSDSASQSQDRGNRHFPGSWSEDLD